ncbi:hypothetical protein HY546_02895 [archaeon]|nr:hypothetical protein [archaeon]
MGYLFFDVEAYVPADDPKKAFNPYMKHSKVLVIAYNHYSGFSSPRRHELKPPTFLLEWVDGEKKILSEFYSLVKRLVAEDVYTRKDGLQECGLKFVGFNMLKFDLPYLFGRLDSLGIASKTELMDNLFAIPRAIDLCYLTPLISRKTREQLEIRPVSQKAANEFFGIPIKEGRGDELSRFYDNRQFDKILKYCHEEFTFEQLYDALLMHILEKQGA